MKRSEIISGLRTFILKELIHDPNFEIAGDTPIISSGLITSFSVVELSLFIETEFGVYIPDADLTIENMDTLEKMANRVEKNLA